MCRLTPSTVDGKLCMKHTVDAGRPKLVASMTKHVDDLKLAGIIREIIAILPQIAKFFGKLKIEWHDFTKRGVRHRQHKVTKEITLDQMEYASSLRIIAHSDPLSKKSEDAVSADLHSLYRSRLGGSILILDACRRCGLRSRVAALGSCTKGDPCQDTE